jgi:hypothetical protein
MMPSSNGRWGRVGILSKHHTVMYPVTPKAELPRSPFVGTNARSYTFVMAITSNCALCGTLAVLIDSHLLPRALYRLTRDNTMKNPNPVLVTKGKDVQTSSQMKRYLLCSVCEDLFSKNGESWVLARCFRGGPANKFLLRDILRTATPMKSDSSGDLVSTVGIVGMDIGKIAYFAASVFLESFCQRLADSRQSGSPNQPRSPTRRICRLSLANFQQAVIY